VKKPLKVLLALFTLIALAAGAFWVSPQGRTWQQSHWDDATLIKFTTEHPENVSAQTVLAERFERSEALTEAMQTYQHIGETLVTGDSAARAYAKAALLAIRQKNAEQALHSAQNAIKAAPSNQQAQKAMGRVYLTLGNTQGAREAFTVVTNKYPEDPDGWEGLASTLLQRKAYSESRAAAERATTLAPQSAQSWRTRGAIEQRLGDLATAQQSLERAMHLDANAPEVYLELGRTLLAMPGKTEEGLRALQTATQKAQNSPAAYAPLLEQGNALMTQHRFREAQSAYEGALQIRPEDSAATFGLARALERQGKVKDADHLRRQFETQSDYEQQIAHLQMRAERDPHPERLLNELGDLYANHQDWRDASIAWQRSLKANPNQTNILQKLTNAQSHL
jgi:tetratricopeptide (TPR) repeat protein